MHHATGAVYPTLTQNGTTVRFSVEHVDRSKTPADPLEEDDLVLVRFRLADSAGRAHRRA